MKNFIFKKKRGNVVGMTENDIAATSNEQKKVQESDYKDLFLHKTDITASKGKRVSIRDEHHERFWKILYALGQNDVTMAEYLDNIIVSHFKTFDKAIKGAYNKHLRLFSIGVVSNVENIFMDVDYEQENVHETDYIKKFVRKTDFTARNGKQVSIRKEHHERIWRILQVIGAKKVTIAEYIDNIIVDHFKTFEEAIGESFNKNLKSYNI